MRGGLRARVLLLGFRLLLVPLLLAGCGALRARATFEEAHRLSERGDYTASLDTYEQILRDYPAEGDRALFERGVLYAQPRNGDKDLRKALECFEELLKSYPESPYRRDSQMMVFYLGTIAARDETIASQKSVVASLREETERKTLENLALQEQVKLLERKVFALATRNGSVEKVLIKKKDRLLMLLSGDEVLKTYKIALGGNPEGPKERRGDNKTPEGTYVIDSRNRSSRYHLSLHISYPNERDKKRARELGVSPGGDIMIHGIKNGFSWVGEAHADVDWTRGCIAVTDEEIEEIAGVVPNGTTVEIRP